MTAVDLKAFMSACEGLAQRYPFFTNPETGARVVPVMGPGWLPLLEHLCEALAAELGPDRVDALRFTDVKSKYGGLRVGYVLSTDDDRLDQAVSGVVGFHEEASERACEHCGAPGRQYDNGGWIATACREHARGIPVDPK